MVRRSTRLSSRNSSTPQRNSIINDGAKTPNTVPAKLTVLEEVDEVPGTFPHPRTSDAMPNKARKPLTETPSKTTPMKPPPEEMHPRYHQQSTAKPRDEARHLGFSNMGSYTAPPKQMGMVTHLQFTPTKSNNLEDNKKIPTFEFTFRRERSLELSPQAKKLMYEKREEAAKIREQMSADGHDLEAADSLLKRKIAVPKSQKGRFSQAHQSQFDKMDSIAGHPSAFRTNSNRSTPQTQTRLFSSSTTSKSLKRSPSKAGLDEPESSPTRPIPRADGETLLSSLKRIPSQSSRRRVPDANVNVISSPTKRVRIAEPEDLPSAKRHAKNKEDERLVTPTTPRSIIAPPLASSKKTLMTPTRATLVRSPNIRSIKASKIPGPSASPAVHVPVQEDVKPLDTQTSLFSRSPVKATIFANTGNTLTQPLSDASPLLSRTPLKGVVLKRQPSCGQGVAEGSAGTPLLARSPIRPPSPGKLFASDETRNAAASTVSLLAKSPVRGLFVKADETEEMKKAGASSLMFDKAPTKFNMPASTDGVQSMDNSGQVKTPGRLNFLQLSPTKSILRTPQRLYSDDPAKVAAGTHFATTPQRSMSDLAYGTAPSGTARKRVDFTSSTKAGEESYVQKTKSNLAKDPLPPMDQNHHKDVSSTGVIEYPTLPVDEMPPSPSPQKRRMTGGPHDFTFRAGDQEIIFGALPKAPELTGLAKGTPTIRHVSSDSSPAPTSVVGRKKRKFDFENTVASTDVNKESSDKENTPAPANDEEDHRPSKRSKLAPTITKPKPDAVAKKAATKVPSSATKQRKGANDIKKRATSISQSRLNALAQPKRRV